MIFTAQHMLLGRINEIGRGGLDMWWERGEEECTQHFSG
jgi:hypothetical protein